MKVPDKSSLEKAIWFGSEHGPGDPGDGQWSKCFHDGKKGRMPELGHIHDHGHALIVLYLSHNQLEYRMLKNNNNEKNLFLKATNIAVYLETTLTNRDKIKKFTKWNEMRHT